MADRKPAFIGAYRHLLYRSVQHQGFIYFSQKKIHVLIHTSCHVKLSSLHYIYYTTKWHAQHFLVHYNRHIYQKRIFVIKYKVDL